MSTVRLEVTLFGAPHFQLDGAPAAAFATRKGQALLIYLICHPKPIPRDLLTGMFWPDSPETAARNSLRHTLSDLRKQFGAFLQSDRQTVEFVRRPPFRLDLDDFLTAQRSIQAGAALTEAAADRLEAALAHYTGEFLAGLNLPDAPAFEDWQFMQREHLRELALRGLNLLIDYFIATGQVRRGLAASQRLLALEPWQESAYQQRMLLLVQNGERNAALQLYELCKQTLAAEFGLPPTAQTTGLYEQIVAGVFDPPHGAEYLTAGSPATPAPVRGPAGNAVLIAAKITRPGYTTAMIDRPRLYRRLDAWRRVRALAIYAPAGYGKSSLVSRWLDVADLAGQAAWLSLDEADADPARFVAYLAAALERVLPEALSLVQPILADPQGDPARALHQLMTALATRATVAAAERDVLLVLDDLQRVQAPAVDALLQQLLEQGPAALHIILLARQRTDLRLARLYAQEMLTLLGADDLRFTAEEVAAYLAAKGFAAPAAMAVAEVTRRSEGWVTALQLAVLSLPHPGDVGELVNALHGTRDWLVEYLVDEVLARQPPELQQFLLKTSILDEFTAPLCAALTGDGGAYAHLAALTRADLFLIPVDAANGWFRYHHLFRAALQHRLQSQAAPSQWASLHHTAAQWLAAADRVRAAVGHFLAAGEGDAAADLVETWLRTTLLRDVNDARRLLGLLPAPVVQRRPRLMLDRCFLSAMLDYQDGDAVLQQAWATLAEHTAAAEWAVLQAEWWVWRSGADFIQRNLAAAADGLAKVAPVLADLADHVVGACWFIQMHLKSYAGDHAAALHCGDQALAAFGRAGYALGTVAVQRELAGWSMRRGNRRAATRRFQALLGSWQRDQISLTRDIAWTQTLAAENSYLQNDLAQACVHQAAAAEMAQQLQDGQLLFLTARMEQVYQALLAASAAACPPVAQAADYIHTAGFLYAFLELETSWLVASGQGEHAWPLIQQFGLTISHRAADYSHNNLMAYLRAYIARGEALADISTLLTGAAAHFAATGARLRQLQVLALTAWQQVQIGDNTAAAASLAQAQRLAEETGYVRVVMDVPALRR